MAFNFILDLLNKWNIQGFILLSLSLQFYLFLFAPLRKKTTNECINFFLWLAYLLANWVAIFTIGLISHKQGNSCTRAAELDGALRALWASFLLLHLGGPTTITAFSLEDTSLWRRHLLSLIFQINVVIYVFVQIFPSDKSLAIPALLVFLAGVIKNLERTWSLYLSTFLELKKMVTRIEIPLDNFNDKLDLGDGYSNEEEAKLVESTVVRHAYFFYQVALVFIGDHIFTRQNRKICRKYFQKVSAVDAFRVISVELNFIYEVFYTKALAMHRMWSHIFHFMAFFCIALAFILFNRLKKHWLSKLDVEITYSLFLGGIAFDMINLFMVVFSDWTVVYFERCKVLKKEPSKLGSFLNNLVSGIYDMRKPRFATCEVKPNTIFMYVVLDKLLIFQRWSESISTCNIFFEILKRSPRKVYMLGRLKDSPRKMYKCDRCLGLIRQICNFPFRMAQKIISWFRLVGKAITTCLSLNVDVKYVSKNPLNKKLWIFIFEEVKRKSKNKIDQTKVKEVFESRGHLFLKSLKDIDCTDLLEYVTEVTYDANIIVWHLATEIWYNIEKNMVGDDKREFSKILSDYMLYLLVNQSNVMSTTVMGIFQERLRDTFHELEDIILGVASKDVEGACMELFKRGAKPPSPRYPKSAVFLGIKLAMRMESLKEKKWEVMSGVWVEMLAFAATHVKGEAHVQVLSKGGELLTFVWLLMIHFGCFYKHGLGMYYGDRLDLSSSESEA